MSFWHGAIGGIAGYVLGGPLGAILGAVIGAQFGRLSSQGSAETQESVSLKTIFATAMVVLAAKMAKSDGRVTRDEVDAFTTAFKRMFNASPEDMQWAGQIFNEARKTSTGYEPYAKQVAEILSPAILEELLVVLLYIAMADGVLHDREMEFLRNVSGIFGFTEQQFQRILSRRGRVAKAEAADPYQILGIPKQSSPDEIKATWRKLVRENHPDRLVSQGLPEEMMEQANEKMADINSAYDRIRKQRKF